MADLMRQWLSEKGIYSSDIEQDFANGYLLGKLLHACGLQTDFESFANKGKPDAYLRNYTKLQPTLSKLGVPLDTRTAHALINKEAGLAGKVLYNIKQALSAMNATTQVLEHSGKTMQQFGVRTAPTPGMLDLQQHKPEQAVYEAGNLKFFEDVMRKHIDNPNVLMESLHLKRFADEGSRQAAAAADAGTAEAAAEVASKAAVHDSLRAKLAASRADKSAKLQRDEAIHAAILKRKGDVERQELKVEMALSDLNRHKQLEQQAAAATDAATGIDAFEMTLKRLGAGSRAGQHRDGELGMAQGPGESPMATLNRITTFAPTAAKLAESGGEYLSAIKARHQEEAAARKEREVRRRKLLVEQQAARTASEQATDTESLLEVLVKQSAEEQKLGQKLWLVKQEKVAMAAERRRREEQYATERDKQWEQSLMEEAQHLKSVRAQHKAVTQQLLAACAEERQSRAAAKLAKRQAFAGEVAWQMVQLAERVIEYRSATAGQAVPRQDWRAWMAMFKAGDPFLGSPVVSPGLIDKEPEETQLVINSAELAEYLACTGDWLESKGPGPVGSSGSSITSAGSAAATGGTTAQAARTVPPAQPLQHPALGRIVADLAALAQQLGDSPQDLIQALHGQDSSKQAFHSAAHGSGGAAAAATPAVLTAGAAVAAKDSTSPARAIQEFPLKISVTGAPCAGKTTTAQALAQMFGLKLLVPSQLAREAAAAATSWKEQQQQQQQHDGLPPPLDQDAVPAGEPRWQVLLGQQVLAASEKGNEVPDELMVDLLLLGMRQAKDYAAPADPSTPPEAKTPKAAAKASAGKAAPQSGGSLAPGAFGAGLPIPAGCPTPGGLSLPPHLAPGVLGRGFVIDGFPATATQAALLEKALTGLDTTAERALVEGASLVAPPPKDALPQLERPLVSGLDAVLLLACEAEELAIKRAVGRRVDPATGRVYHLDFDPPIPTTPGLAERLAVVADPGCDAQQVSQRLSSYATASEPLCEWLARFSTLQKPLDGTAALTEVLIGARDVVNGILAAKAAAHAAKAAADAASRAGGSAIKAKECAQTAQGCTETAACELLALKKAEVLAVALLNTGKNPDPASTEVLKGQAAAKCAEQLKLCRTSGAEAAASADRAAAAADAAAVAVLRCKLAVRDALVSAEAENAASKAAVDAEAAAAAATEAAKKAEACRQLSQGFVAEAEKWFAALDIPIDAAVPSTQQLTAVLAATADAKGAAAVVEAVGSATAASLTAASGSAKVRPLPAAATLPAAVIPLLQQQWQLLEGAFVEGMSRGLAGVRQARSLAVDHVASSCSFFRSFLHRADAKQAVLQSFLERFNAVELDMRKAKETQGELLLRGEELRDALWGICDSKHEEAEAARLKLVNDGSTAEHISLLGLHLVSLVQVELDRFLGTCQFLYSYCCYAHGVYTPYCADKPLCPLPTALLGAAGAAGVEAAGGGTGAAGSTGKGSSSIMPPPPAYMTSLQQRLPQVAAALKAAAAAGTATHANVLALVDEATKKCATAAAATASVANTSVAGTNTAAAAAGEKAIAGAHKVGVAANAKAAGASTGVTTGAARLPNSNQAAAASLEQQGPPVAAAENTSAAAAPAAAAKPDVSDLAAISADLQSALSLELLVLQQRLGLLGSKAAILVDELVQLKASAMGQLAEWQHKRYVAECGAVSALERIVKAAAAAGQPLPHDLRLEDDLLVVDESKLLLPAPVKPPTPRPPSPALPPGVLSVQQLQQLATALAAAAPGGFLAVDDAAQLMLRMCNQGVLPESWQDIDALHMVAALSQLDPTYSGYLDWRQLLLSLAAAAIPAVQAAGPAQVAVQASALALADKDKDGFLTQEEFEAVQWWWAPDSSEGSSPHQSTGRQLCTPAGDDEAGHHGEIAVQGLTQELQRELTRCKQFKQLLWSVFQQHPSRMGPAPQVSSAPAVAVTTSPPATSAAPATPVATKRPNSKGSANSSSHQLATGAMASPAGKASASSDRGLAAVEKAVGNSPQAAGGVQGSSPVGASGSSSSSQRSSPDGYGAAIAPEGAPTQGASQEASPPAATAPLFNWRAALLYLCPDRDLHCGVLKAAAAVTGSSAAASTLDTVAVVRMCYPLMSAEQAAPIQRAPMSPTQIAVAVAAAAAGATTVSTIASPVTAVAVDAHAGKTTAVVAGQQGESSLSSTAATGSSRGTSAAGSSNAGGGGGPVAAGQLAAIKAPQLLYGTACERVMTLLLHRYHWVDVYIAARL